MSLSIKDLKESNEFLNILFENITSAVFLIDKEYQIQTVNSTFETVFKKTPNEIIGNLCGDVIGCAFTFEESVSCGATSHCKSCNLRNSFNNCVFNNKSVKRKILTRDFVIGDNQVKKHFLYSTKPIRYMTETMAMIILDDITESEEQKQIIQEKNNEITQSIHYARGIQKTILPHKNTVFSVLPDSFIFYQPKDIISGDFYWVAYSGDKKYFAVADCTGHGVPGAIMSVLGTALLNEIVQSNKYKSANDILDKLRKEIIKALKQQGMSGEHRDGMDIALCCLSSKKMELEFAGANSPLYIVTGSGFRIPGEVNTKHETQNPELIEIKGDKMPIGIHERMDAFTSNKIKLKKGDCIYLFSDGLIDQFGGPDKKKFKSSRFKELLCRIYSHSMNDQKHDIEIEYLKWKSKNEQVDDITIMGVRV